jgi:osmotically-inducible protein OsmY
MNKANRAWILGLVVLAQFSLVACNKADEATASLSNQQPVPKEVVDSQVTVNVKQALAADEKTQSLLVAVVTLKGDVKLSGAVDQQSQIDYIEGLVRGVQGVHSLHNELRIKQ